MSIEVKLVTIFKIEAHILYCIKRKSDAFLE
jgi:hypothetical protein